MIKRLAIKDIKESEYNPRVSLVPGSKEYEEIKKSLIQYGLVEPPIVNEHNMTCIGGHQRISVLRGMGVEYVDCSIVNIADPVQEKKLCILTLQFTAPESRQQILKKIYDHTANGGALILVEKVQGSDAMTDDLLTTLYYNNKRKNGYTDTQIYTKRKSLTGELVPLKAEWNEQLLREAGFSHVECIWRHLNFMGWVAVK